MQFESEHTDSHLPLTAKREHIEKLYKHDKHGMNHVLYRLTDTHLSAVTQCAMKVSVAAQTISHTVAVGIYTLVSSGKEWCLHSFVIRNNITYSNTLSFLVGKLFFKLASCVNETHGELLQFLCFHRGVQQQVTACGCVFRGH